MFEIDGKVFRNIQEQVQKNKSDIAGIKNVEMILNEFGVKVLGRVDTEAEIPEGTYEYGDAYLVGTETPYDMYIYTRDDSNGEFINIGPISMVGPQGVPGERGETGATGETGPAGPTGNGIYTITKTGTDGLVDTYTISYTNGTSTTFTVTNGANGQNGADGDPGESFMIMGVISSTSLLPDPSTTPRNEAYILDDGDASTPDKLYYIAGPVGEEVWSYSSFAAAGTTVSVNGSPTYAWNADTKLDKVTTSTTYDQVYVKNTSGGQGIQNYSENVVPYALVARNWEGQIAVPSTPVNSTDATSKSYVDNNFASISVAGEEYDPTRTYNKFEHCRHDGKAYYCFPADTATGPWDASKWTEFNMGQLFYTSLNLDNNKLDKDTSITTYDQAYVKLADGTQSVFDIDKTSNSTMTANGLVRRKGQYILTPTPTSNAHAANKQYVDNKFDAVFTNIADFVVEQGTSGYWGYRKWHSGVAECWTITPIGKTMTPNQPWGSLYNTGNDNIGGIAFPFTFVSNPVESAKLIGGQGGWMNWEVGPSTTTSGSYQWIRPTAGGTVNMTLYLYEIGRWK